MKENIFGMVSVKKINENTLKMIEAIRRNPGCTKSELANIVDMPWSSAYTILTKIGEKLVILPENNEENTEKETSTYYRAGISLISSHEYYVGVSVGSSQLKIVILGFDFNIVSLDVLDKKSKKTFNLLFDILSKANFDNEEINLCKWCKTTPKDILALSKDLVEFGDCLCEMKKQGVPIVAINYTLPGHIDYYNQTIISTSHLCNDCGLIKNTGISRLITSTLFNKLNNNDINVYIDHNVKSSAIAEKEQRLVKGCKKDLIILYLGHGIGMSIVIDGKVYRDKDNFAGQLDEIEVFFDNQPQKFGDVLRNEIFKNTNIDSSAEALKNYIFDVANRNQKEALVKLLAQVLRNLFFVFGIKDIVFSGKFNDILDCVEFELSSELENSGVFGFNLHHSFYGQYSASIGAAMNCFYNNINTEYHAN